MKVLLILVDGMRPDALEHSPTAMKMLDRFAYTLQARAVMPAKTLSCHMSLFHSVDPERHGTMGNIYVEQARPVRGLCEVLLHAGKRSAFFYNWEELRDLTRPNSLVYSYFCKGSDIGYEKANIMVTEEALRRLAEDELDFAFLYLGLTDDAGHKFGWMSEEYLQAVESSWKHIQRVIDTLPEEYTVIVTADHGGHAKSHGLDIPEDMTIPVMITGTQITPGKISGEVSIKDIAPVIVKLLGVAPDAQWEGKCFI